MATVRPAAVAGSFYPRDPKELDASVQYYLAEAAANIKASQGPVPKAIVAPHAGFIYSGLTAAAAYARVYSARDRIKRVVMMGPCHHVALKGIALSGASAFATPLGDVPIDKAAVSRVVELDGVKIFDEAHRQDHSLEVHLPFLQVLLDEFSIIPFIVGQASIDQVSNVLEQLWGGNETLILISSDLSHYLSYDAARLLDDETRRAIEQLDILALGDNQACGHNSLKGLMMAAGRRGLKASTVDVRNSGDTAGDKDRVVGYGSWVLVPGGAEGIAAGVDNGTAVTVTDKSETLSAATRLISQHFSADLLQVAADSICYTLNNGKQLIANIDSFPAELRKFGACFVTLNLAGKLRGCVGTLQGTRPLVADIADNAYRAAFKDLRFAPLQKDELNKATRSLSVSILSPQVPMAFSNEADLLHQLRPETDGLVLLDQGRRAVFLPEVWETLPDPTEFIAQLKRKAELAKEHWSDTLRVWRFTSEVVHSNQLSNPDDLWDGLD